MKLLDLKQVRLSLVGAITAALAMLVVIWWPLIANADEADAKRLLKEMSDYMASKENISFEFDATLEVITKDKQKLALASSGAVALKRPNKIHVTRAGGHASIEMLFDGKTLTLFGENANLYTQINIPGTLDNVVDVLREKYKRPVPAADLIMSNVYDQLMADVTDVKDLGSGVIEGVECDYFAFRKDAIDLQIWVAHGLRPYPCQYVITSKDIPHSPQYIIRIRNFKTGSLALSTDFVFDNPTKAKKIDLKDLKGISDFPDHFKRGVAQ